MPTDTIVAACTPQGSGAIALIRISGDHAITVAQKMCILASGKTLSELPTHTIHFGTVLDETGQQIDRVLFLLMHAPKTFTGNDTVEITCHNNPFIIQAIIEQAIKQGARLAGPGEFTQQAVLNNKLDLVQAEALNELIHANTQKGLKKALAQLEGTLSAHLESIEHALLKALTLSEASFEFLDEETVFDDQIKEQINAVALNINTIKVNFDQQQHIRQGIRIAIIGSVNAGKSSLFNALLKKDRAIVTPVAGTTRDTVEAGLYRHGTYLTLIDTAGLRITHDSIEQEGIKRSWHEAALADIILLVHDSSRPVHQEEQDWYEKLIADYTTKIISINNKIDLVQQDHQALLQNTIEVSCTKKIGLELLEQKILEKITSLFEKDQAPFLLNQRQFTLILELEKRIETMQPLLAEKSIRYEIIAYHLKEALAHCAQLTGKTIQEHMFNKIFSTFCIGK
jgi:tRNA modification GTPase